MSIREKFETMKKNGIEVPRPLSSGSQIKLSEGSKTA